MSGARAQQHAPSRPLQLSSSLLAGSSGGATGPSSAPSGGSRSGLVQQFALYNNASTAAASSGSNPATNARMAGLGARPSGGVASSSVTEQHASAGLVLNAQQHTGPSSARALAPARLKLDELLQHWSQLPETETLVGRLIAEAMAQLNPSAGAAAREDPTLPGPIARGANTNNSSGGSAAAVASPASAASSSTKHHGASGRGAADPDAVVITDDDSTDEGDFELPEEQGAAPRPVADVPAVVASPPAGQATNNPRSSGGGNTSSGKPRRAGDPSSPSTVPDVAVSMDDLPGDLGGFALGSASDGASETTPNKVPGTSAARRAAAGDVMPSPRSAMPAGAMHTPPTRTPREGMGRHLGPNGMLADEMDVAHRYGALSPRSISPAAQDGTHPARSPFDAVLRSPRAAPAFGGLDAPPKSRSPSPQPHSSPAAVLGVDGDSDRENTPRIGGTPGGRRRSLSSLGSSMNDLPSMPAAKVPVATKDDIPRFYYGRGRQLHNPDTLADEVSSRAQATKEASARARAADEREVQLMNRFVSQATAAAAAATASGSAVGKRPGANGRLASAKRGGTSAASQQEVVQTAVRSLTTEAFGLPRVLSTVVASKVVKQPGNALTLAQVRTFYDTCIAKNTRPRRIFETLLGSSPLAPAIERGSLGQRRNHLVKEDFTLLLTSLVEHHPGLSFLKEAADFQSKYIETVLLRIFYECDPRDTGRVTWEAFANSELPGAIQQLAETDEINHVLAFFSYEHFYVLYCRFWELDSDKDLYINAADFERYFPEQTANDLLVQRVFAGVGRKLQCRQKDRMGYDDFVYFCIGEEDKTSPRALRYWFKLLDIDGDGILSGYELAAFYDITKKRWEQLTGEAISFPDVMCQIADMLVGPAHDGTAPAEPQSSPPSSSPTVPSRAASSVAPTASARPQTGLDLMQRFGSSRPATPAGPSSSGSSSPAGSSTLPAAGSSGSTPALGGGSAIGKGSKPPQPRAAANKGAATPTPAGSSAVGGMSWAALPAGTDPMSIGFTLADLMKRPLAASVAITMLTNVSKFLQYEQRDPFVVAHERAQGGLERNEWDRFCRAEYDRMSLAEEEG